jgi:hypothetical protein
MPIADLIVMWMNQDDTSIFLHVDLYGAVRRFIDRYSQGPMGIKRINAPASLSCLSTSHDSNRGDEGVIDANRACSDAHLIVDQIDRQILDQSHNNYNHKPSSELMINLIATLCRGTFLSPPTDEEKDNEPSLATIINYHIPIHETDIRIFEYLDSGVHGYVLPQSLLLILGVMSLAVSICIGMDSS